MPISTTSGGIVTFGTPGPKPSSSPPSTSRIGYGIRSGPARISSTAPHDEQHEELELLLRAELDDQHHRHNRKTDAVRSSSPGLYWPID